MPQDKKDWTNLRVGNLTVLREVPPTRKYEIRWAVRCDCGVEKTMASGELGKCVKRGKAMCQPWCPKGNGRIREAVWKHGMWDTPEYRVWRRMKQRCYVKGNASYARYGGRGIEVCPPWRKDFLAFLTDMGKMPAPKMSIDRIDGDKGYFKENCRWATPKQQANNRNTNVFIETPWGRMTISEAAEKSGIPYHVMLHRVKNGKKHKDLFRPVRTQNETFLTQWGELTLLQACARVGLSPKVAWSRLARGVTDPERLFTTEDLRLRPLPKK